MRPWLGAVSIVRPEWGAPSPIGSAARLAVIMAAVRGLKRSRGAGEEAEATAGNGAAEAGAATHPLFGST